MLGHGKVRLLSIGLLPSSLTGGKPCHGWLGGWF
jgi:hypothetical protein